MEPSSPRLPDWAALEERLRTLAQTIAETVRRSVDEALAAIRAALAAAAETVGPRLEEAAAALRPMLEEAAATLGPQLVATLARVPDTTWAALVSAIVTLVLATGLLPRRAAEATTVEADGACNFLINGSSLKPLTGPARSLLESIGGNTTLQALTRHVERDCERIRDDLEGLILYGESFRRHCLRGDGSSYEVLGEPRGGAAFLSIRPATPEARALDQTERALACATEELAGKREALDRAPILIWTVGPDGQVTWANAAYRECFDKPEAATPGHRLPDVFAHVLEEVPLTARSGCERRRRVRIATVHDTDPHWFEVSQLPAASGETLSYAIDADDLVAAEASLRRFVETLTETFAHLPIGLAVFDKNRRLGLFNPALSDLVKIDAVWLAGRPSLRDFLERLRETRQMPEQKDFAAFRRMLTELEESAREGTYEENWVLPSGKIFRVTGRPHPQGALAFLFEDISPSIQLERRYRAELELSQATLDRMAEAVAVFDTSGMLVFVNSAFERLWGLDPMHGLEGPNVAELTALWESRCASSPIWNELRAFATGADARTSWTSSAVTLDGQELSVLVAPLPNGSTLVTFRRAEGGAPAAAAVIALPAPDASATDSAIDGDRLRRSALLAALAFAEVEAPAEAALANLGAAIGTAANPTVFAGLTRAAQALKDGLARARALQVRAEQEALRAGGSAPADLAGRLAALLAARGLTLAPRADAAPQAVDAGAWGDHGDTLHRALPPLVMALAAIAAPGAGVELDVNGDDGPLVVVLRVPLAGAATLADPEPPGLAVARRRLDALGVALEVMDAAGGVRLAARFAAPAQPRLVSASA